MLDRNIDQIDNTETTTSATTPAAVPAPAAQPAAPALVQGGSVFSRLLGAFAANGIDIPVEATVGCTIIGGAMKFGSEMQHDFGDWAVIRPMNLTVYEKVNLGIKGTASPEEKKLMETCKDGQTVTHDEVTYTKAEYLAFLKTQGYSNAKFENRAVLHGVYIDSDRNSKIGKELKNDDIIAVWLSPSSLKAWNAFVVKSSLTSAQGDLKLTKVDARNASAGHTWTHFAFEAVPQVERQAA